MRERTQEGRGPAKLAVVIAAVLGGNAAVADQAAPGASARSGIEEIVVTATRREEALQDVPLSVSALNSAGLEARGVSNLGELSAGKLPGFVPTRFSGGTTLAIAIRGVGLADPTQGTTEMPVPVYIDGVFLGRGQGLGMQLIDPERVEILRGPQGQLFGRNAEGGVVQYVSKKPTGEFGIKAEASFGNYADRRIKASINLPEMRGLSMQVSGLMAEHDPYTAMNRQSNYPPGSAPPTPNYGHNLLDASGGRFAARWRGETVTVDYTYDTSDEFSTEGYVTWMDVDVTTPAFAANQPTEDLPEKTFQKLNNLGFQVNASGHNLTAVWDMSDAITLKSISSYREVKRRGANTLGTSLPAGLSSTDFVYTWGGLERVDQDQTSQEFQFIGGWDQFDLTMGAMYYNEQVTDYRQSRLTGPGLVGPVTFILPSAISFCVDFALDPCPTTSAEQSAESTSYGIYAQGSYRPSILPGLELILGLRYTDDRKDALRYMDNGAPVHQPAEFSASRVDPAGTIKYSWSDDLQAYLRYATGYRAGGANVRSSGFTSFEEEENEAWELGLKSLWFSNRVQANLALFQNTIKGEQLPIQEAPVSNPALTNSFNSPKDKKVKGIELELAYAITDSLGIGGNYAYMDVRKQEDYDNPFTPVVDVSRFWPVSTPKNSGSVYVDWTGSNGWFFHTDYAFAEGHFWTTPGAQQIAGLLPTYERPESDMKNWSARLGYTFTTDDDGKFQVALWGKNLTDDSSITYGFDGCAFGGGFCAFRQAPRTYGVEMQFEY